MFWLKKWLGGLIMPLPLALTLLIIGLLLLWWTRRQRLGKLFCSLGTLLILLCALRPVSVAILRPLEQSYPPFDGKTQVDYILVLGHGHVSDPTVPVTSQPTSTAYARVMEAIELKRQQPAAKLIFSGNISSDPISCAEMYARIAEHYGIDRKEMTLIEDAFDTQDEITRYKALIGDHPAALVTSASHMPRAMDLARGVGLHVTPAPTDYMARLPQREIPSWGYMPEGRYLLFSETAWHEWIGRVWHRLRGQSKE